MRDDRVPQMAGAEEVVAAIEPREGTENAGLVLNLRGYERLRATSLDRVNCTLAATETFNERNGNMSLEEALAQVQAILGVADLRTTVTVSVAFGCPFEGRVDPGRVDELCGQLRADEIVLADTIGVATPTQVRRLVERVRKGTGDVGVHLHNTRNTGYVNALAALESGATILDASVGGLGGCPYAPRATGNIATEDLVYLLEGEGVADRNRPRRARGRVRMARGRARPAARRLCLPGGHLAAGRRVNRLARETSPYLLQHADNPVDWHAWGDEAFAKARAEDRPILLSIGYAACHWCHVMAHESFEDPETAALMNELFVNVKVDREERPDVDSLYMDAVLALTGSGGWPMTVFLTPDGEPFLGGTYFPPEPRHGLPGFRQVLRSVAETYRERRGDVVRQAKALTESVRASARMRGLARAADRVAAARGRARSPVRLRRAKRRLGPRAEVPASLDDRVPAAPRRGSSPRRRRSTEWRSAACTTSLGGGFHRYSVDERWLVPHFEKMLYDNALLVPAYLHGWLVTGTRATARSSRRR